MTAPNSAKSIQDARNRLVWSTEFTQAEKDHLISVVQTLSGRFGEYQGKLFGCFSIPALIALSRRTRLM